MPAELGSPAVSSCCIAGNLAVLLGQEGNREVDKKGTLQTSGGVECNSSNCKFPLLIRIGSKSSYLRKLFRGKYRYGNSRGALHSSFKWRESFLM